MPGRVPVLLILLAVGVAGNAMAEVPLPPPRPPGLESEGGPPALPTGDVPLPPERPADGPPPTAPPRPADGVAARPEQPADPGCRARLEALGASAEPLPRIAEGACVVEAPLKVVALAGGLRVNPPATLGCTAAEALALWVRDAVGPAALRELGATPSAIAVGTSYQCRSRRGDTGGKLSEHAFADAVDISGFSFAGRPAVTMGRSSPDTPEKRFEDAIRAAACGPFATVLGPGTNAEHADHLHLDALVRRHGFRYCK